MEILHQLGELFLEAVPTIIVVLLFYAFLRWAFFGPIQKAMAERAARIEGARAEAASVEAAAKQELDTYHEALAQGPRRNLRRAGSRAPGRSRRARQAPEGHARRARRKTSRPQRKESPRTLPRRALKSSARLPRSPIRLPARFSTSHRHCAAERRDDVRSGDRVRREPGKPLRSPHFSCCWRCRCSRRMSNLHPPIPLRAGSSAG